VIWSKRSHRPHRSRPSWDWSTSSASRRGWTNDRPKFFFCSPRRPTRARSSTSLPTPAPANGRKFMYQEGEGHPCVYDGPRRSRSRLPQLFGSISRPRAARRTRATFYLHSRMCERSVSAGSSRVDAEGTRRRTAVTGTMAGKQPKGTEAPADKRRRHRRRPSNARTARARPKRFLGHLTDQDKYASTASGKERLDDGAAITKTREGEVWAYIRPTLISITAGPDLPRARPLLRPACAPTINSHSVSRVGGNGTSGRR